MIIKKKLTLKNKITKTNINLKKQNTVTMNKTVL